MEFSQLRISAQMKHRLQILSNYAEESLNGEQLLQGLSTKTVLRIKDTVLKASELLQALDKKAVIQPVSKADLVNIYKDEFTDEFGDFLEQQSNRGNIFWTSEVISEIDRLRVASHVANMGVYHNLNVEQPVVREEMEIPPVVYEPTLTEICPVLPRPIFETNATEKVESGGRILLLYIELWWSKERKIKLTDVNWEIPSGMMINGNELLDIYKIILQEHTAKVPPLPHNRKPYMYWNAGPGGKGKIRITDSKTFGELIRALLSKNPNRNLFEVHIVLTEQQMNLSSSDDEFMGPLLSIEEPDHAGGTDFIDNWWFDLIVIVTVIMMAYLWISFVNLS